MLYVVAIILFGWIVLLIHRPVIYGNKKNLRTKGGVIFIANHRNLLDPVMLAVTVPRCIHFMAKKELFESKIGNWVFRSLLVFPVNRKTADFKSLRQALSLLEQGKAFGIFPEGHRSATGSDMDAFDKGCAFIALRADAPVIPLYIVHHGRKFGQRLKVAVGDPILPSEVKARCPGKKPVEAVNAAITDAMISLKGIAEAL